MSMELAKKNKVTELLNFTKKLFGIVNEEIPDAYIQELTQCIGGKVYLDKITGKAFMPNNLADGVVRVGTWLTADSNWTPLDIRKLAIRNKVNSVDVLYAGGALLGTGAKSVSIPNIADGTYKYLQLRISKITYPSSEIEMQVTNTFNRTNVVSFGGVTMTRNPSDNTVTLTYETTPAAQYQLIGAYLNNNPLITY